MNRRTMLTTLAAAAAGSLTDWSSPVLRAQGALARPAPMRATRSGS